MQVTMSEGIYIAESRYPEREIPKAAGMRWNATAQRWQTTDWRIALKLAEYCDDAARAAIEAGQQAEADSREASRATDAEIEIPAPGGLEYMPFQMAGIAYALARETTLIGDEMGLGKTVEALGVVNAREDIRRVLIICPASLRINWRREAERWLTRRMSVEIADSGELPAADVTIINYDILHRHEISLRARAWDLLIVDECHYLKNPKARRTQEVFGHWDRDPDKRIAPIPARRRLYLTGTPIVNRPIELWPILRSVGWRNWRDFVVRYCAGYQDKYGWKVDGASHLEELQDKLRSTIMVRRLKRDVLAELPAKRRQVIELPANGAEAVVQAEADAWATQRDRLEALQAAVEMAKASESDEDYRAAVEALREGMQVAFTEMARLRHETALAKVPYVIEHLCEAVDSSGRVVCYAHHHDVIAAIRAGLTEAGIESVALTGEMGMMQRQESVDCFQAEDGPAVFVGSIQAAGLGITLTAASHVVFAELDWVPGNMSQAEDRLHRIGQRESVLVQHLVLEGSLDAEIARRLVEKQAVIDRALDRPGEAAAIEPGWGTLISIGDASTRRDSRAEIEEQAENISAHEIEAIHAQLRMLAGMCDGAQRLDGAGFSRYDAPTGHRLAALPTLTPRQAALGRRMVCTYRAQLEAAGFRGGEKGA